MLTPAGSACTGARLVWRSCRCGAAPCWARPVPTVLTVAQLCPSARRAAPGGLLREGVARRSGGVRGVPRGNCSTWRSFAGASLSYGNEAIKMASQVLLSLSLSLTAQELFPLFHPSVPFREVRAHLGSTQVYHMNVWWAKYQMQR